MPSLRKARESAIRVQCASNLKQWGNALTAYMTDNRGDMPRSWGPLFNGVYPYTYRVRTPASFDTYSITFAPSLASSEIQTAVPSFCILLVLSEGGFFRPALHFDARPYMMWPGWAGTNCCAAGSV